MHLDELTSSMTNFDENKEEDRLKIIKIIMKCLDEWEIVYHNTVVFNFEARDYDGLGYWCMLIDQRDFKQLHVLKKLNSIKKIVGPWIYFNDIEQVNEADIVEVIYSV